MHVRVARLALSISFVACAQAGGPEEDTIDAGASDAQPVTPPASGCHQDSDCDSSSAGKVCDVPTRRCVQCLAGHDTCPSSTYCDVTQKTCVFGCKADSDCSGTDGGVCAAKCDPQSHKCMGCCADGDCPAGSVCDRPPATCVPGCTTMHACANGEACCTAKCIDLQSDAANCGGCAKQCANPAHATAACSSGACGLGSCDSGFGDCNMQASDGCEIDTNGDIANCGSCGAVCGNQHATPSCSSGKCSLACASNWGDCDKKAANGCEADLSADTSNCGACGKFCFALNAKSTCAAGQCGFTCNADYGDCDKNPATGCEAWLKTTTDCGSCGVACSPPNAFGACWTGTCQISFCNGGWTDCNKIAGDGCEVHTAIDKSNCGSCGNVCPMSKTCMNGFCF